MAGLSFGVNEDGFTFFVIHRFSREREKVENRQIGKRWGIERVANINRLTQLSLNMICSPSKTLLLRLLP